MKAHLERLGWLVCRAAGSHGEFDLFAVHYVTGEVLLVQAKRSAATKAELSRFRAARIPERAHAELWVAKRGGHEVVCARNG